MMPLPQSRITGPGAPFELIDAAIRGVPCRVFRRGPVALSEIYRRAALSLDREFMTCDQRRVTNREILTRASIVARALMSRAGVRAGMRVALVMGNHAQWLISFVAITSIGATAVALHDRTPVTGIRHSLEIARCSCVVAENHIAEALRQSGFAGTIVPVMAADGESYLDENESGWSSSGSASVVEWVRKTELAPDSAALIALTSGTTGGPKGAILSHRSMMTGMMNMLLGGALASANGPPTKVGGRASPPVSLVLAPFSYIAGYSNILLMWYLGGRVIAARAATIDAAVEKLDVESVTAIVGITPVLLAQLLRVPRSQSAAWTAVRSVNVHGGHIAPALRDELSVVLPNVAVGTGYGMTETNGSVCTASASELLTRPKTCGRPLPTVDMRIVQQDGSDARAGAAGEILLRGAMVMQGYCGQEECTTEALAGGWFKTGDVGRLDADNYLEIVDRLNDVWIPDAAQVSASEIERAVVEAGFASQAVALGVEDRQKHRKIVLVIVTDGGDGKQTPTQILEHLQAGGVIGPVLPEVVAVESLPLTPSGKVDKPELRRRILATNT